MSSIFLYIFYFFRSVYYRGPVKTFRLLALEPRYEKRFGIKTLQIKKSDHLDNYHYQGASYMVLMDLLKKLPYTLYSKPFIDLGSGKGRALFCAEYAGFNHLIGVELDKELVDEAKTNELSYTQKRKESCFEFIRQNVLDYKIPDDSATFFLFNPFSETVMKQVVQAILKSHEKNKREIYIVYVNPRFKNVWEENGFTLFFKEGNSRYTEALIYKI